MLSFPRKCDSIPPRRCSALVVDKSAARSATNNKRCWGDDAIGARIAHRQPQSLTPTPHLKNPGNREPNIGIVVRMPDTGDRTQPKNAIWPTPHSHLPEATLVYLVSSQSMWICRMTTAPCFSWGTCKADIYSAQYDAHQPQALHFTTLHCACSIWGQCRNTATYQYSLASVPISTCTAY